MKVEECKEAEALDVNLGVEMIAKGPGKGAGGIGLQAPDVESSE